VSVSAGTKWRRFSSVATIAMALVVPTARAAGVEQPAAALRFVGDRDYAPFTFLEAGMPRGLDVDVALAVADRLGRAVQIDLMDWEEAQQQVRAGRADGLLSMSRTPDRQEIYAFTEPTTVHEFGVFVRRSNPVIRSASDLSDMRVGVTAGRYPQRFFAANAVRRLVRIDNYEDGFRQLSAGTLDAVAADTWGAAQTIRERGLRDIDRAGPAFDRLPAGFALRKDAGPLRDDINAVLRRMKADGTLDDIHERWRPHQGLAISRDVLWDLLRVIAGISLIALGARRLRGRIKRTGAEW